MPTCWRCLGETADSKDFPETETCGIGQAYDYPETIEPNCNYICFNPDRREGKLACIYGNTWLCTAANGWEVTGEPCLTDCGFQDTESDCSYAGCYWYSYPSPFGEKTCRTQHWVESYLPHIIVATGIAALAVSLISLYPRKGRK